MCDYEPKAGPQIDRAPHAGMHRRELRRSEHQQGRPRAGGDEPHQTRQSPPDGKRTPVKYAESTIGE